MNQTIKTALVTGAAQGLGLAIAEELAASGYNLILLDRKEEQLQKAADQIRQQGHLVHTRVIDLSQTEEIKPIIDDIGQTVGQLHVLVNNAGVNQVKPMDQVTSADWDFVMNVNLKAVFFIIQAASRIMADGGSIVNIASVAANSPRPLSAAYAASKAGVVSVTKTASVTLSPRRIRVNAVCPGAMDTDLLAFMAEEMSSMSGKSAEESLRNYTGDIPLARLGAPADVARTVSFLASDAAGYITGQTVNVCGGWTVK